MNTTDAVLVVWQWAGQFVGVLGLGAVLLLGLGMLRRI